jgi:peptidyl-tRNA hydrolase, PTH1 family
MRLLVGLGNPGPGYAKNRHNIGFMAADAIVRRHSFAPWRTRFHGLAAEGPMAGAKLLALKPQTYMNLSGEAAAAALRFYKLEPRDTIVIHDDLDLRPGQIRVKQGGGNGGHNGLRSLDAHLGPDYWRVRLGIGHPGIPELVHHWVLQDFIKADAAWLGPLLEAVAEAFPLLVAGDDGRFLNKVVVALQPPRPKAPRPEAAGKTDPGNKTDPADGL